MQGTAIARVQVPLPRGRVYGLLADPGRRPEWIRDLKRVVPLANGRDQWVLHGPAGSLLWEVQQTVDRAPDTLAWCMTGPEGAGFMRFDLAEVAGGTRITARRFLGFRRPASARLLDHWWGQPELRLQGDLSHLVELLRSGSGPQVNAVGFRPTASRP